MKKLLFFALLLYTSIHHDTYATSPPANLYEQLCKVNQEWYQYKEIAKKNNYINMKIIENEQDLLVFHIKALEMIFKKRNLTNLSPTQLLNRKKNLKVLNEYWNRHDCPINYDLSYRNPVFIDREGRYCAVGYLMLKSGKEIFCKNVQKNNNLIYIREIKNDEFTEWQQQSGLSIDELAWIQPGYSPYVRLVGYGKFDKKGKPIYLPQSQANLYYNMEKDTENIMSTIFFQNRIDVVAQLKKLNYKGKQPNWEIFTQESGTKRITAVTVFKEDIYIGVDSVYYNHVNDTTIITTQYSVILKYTQKGEWETALDLKGKHRVYKLKNFNGNLLAYGGYVEHDKITYKARYESFLGEYDGKKWKIDDKNYQGIIFKIIASKGKINYIATTVNELDFMNPDGTLIKQDEQ